jgi:putative oligomerization/nucleic acid binding protein
MPGLLRGMARTAVVAGTATAVSNRVSRRQANRWASQGDPNYGGGYSEPAYQEQSYAQAPPPPPAAAPVDPVQALKDLAALHEQGVLTDAEFSAQKARILST